MQRHSSIFRDKIIHPTNNSFSFFKQNCRQFFQNWRKFGQKLWRTSELRLILTKLKPR